MVKYAVARSGSKYVVGRGGRKSMVENGFNDTEREKQFVQMKECPRD